MLDVKGNVFRIVRRMNQVFRPLHIDPKPPKTLTHGILEALFSNPHRGRNAVLASRRNGLFRHLAPMMYPEAQGEETADRLDPA